MNELDKAVSAVRRATVVVLVLSGLTSVLILALPFYMSQVFVRVLPSRSEETLLALSVMVAIAFILYGICEFVKLAILARAGTRYEAQLSGPIVYSHFLDRTKDSASGSELMQDVQRVRNFVGSRAFAGVTEAPFIPFFVLILFAVDTAIGGLIIGGMVLMVLLAILQERAIRNGIENQTMASQSAGRMLQSFIDQSEVVRVFGLQKVAIARWGVPKAAALSSFIETTTTGALYGSIAKSLRMMIQVAILGVGAYLAIQGAVSAVVVFACMIIGGRALAPLDGLVGSWSALSGAMAAHRRVRDALATFYVESESTQLPTPRGHYEISQLVYGLTTANQAIIKRISFEVSAGQTLGIVGPSGAGKSTLLRLIAGALEPASGSVRLDGADLRHWNRIQLGQHIGYVPQSVEFFPGTVAENIARFDPDATDEAVVEAARLAGVHDMILRFPSGYDTYIGRGLFSPSGGQKQLLAVARAFYHDPKVLLFDEPNSNLDAKGDHILMQAIGRAQQRGATIIVVTQRPILLQAVHHVLILNDGMIEQFGSRADVLPKLVKPAEVAKEPSNESLASSEREFGEEAAGGQATSGLVGTN